ncbi:MAG: hypothetical protein ACKOWG_13705, partial [Planctomycetia bacterium]
MKRFCRPLVAALSWLLVVGGGGAWAQVQAVDAPPAANPLAELDTLAYHPKETAPGSIRLAGSSTLQQAAAHWADGFHRLHPDVEC